MLQDSKENSAYLLTTSNDYINIYQRVQILSKQWLKWILKALRILGC
jgi:hypothetical protein